MNLPSKKVLFITTFIALGGMLMFFSLFDVLGRSPSTNDKQKFHTSKNYNNQKATFVNTNQEHVDRMWDQSFTLKNISRQLGEYSRAKNLEPTFRIPEVTPDFEAFSKSQQGMKVIWFGHSSFLLNMEGVNILVDPVFGNASPVAIAGKRFQKAVASPELLPAIDVIVISHDHYDHLEMDSVKFYANTDTQFVVPLGVGSHLRHWGVNSEKIIERDWWQSQTINSIEFTATPAQHFSGRAGFHSNNTLWASWVIQSPNHKIYFSGDSGYGDHFKEIGEKLGPFDLAFIETGQYNPQWRSIHMLPEDGIQAFKDLGAQKYFPIHWGMFTLSLHTWDDPIKKISQLTSANNIELVAPQIGETIDIGQRYLTTPWWEDIQIDKILAQASNLKEAIVRRF